MFMSLLILLFVQESFCTHLETCECHEIRSLVNASVEQAIARLEDKLTTEIRSAIGRVHTTRFDDKFDSDNGVKESIKDLEIDLTSTIKELLKPIQRQLDYHLPPPPISYYTEDNPAESCKDLHELYYDAPSDYYWVKDVSGSPVLLYCNMNDTCGNLTGGWTRVAYLDMRNSSHQCPSGFTCTVRSSNPRRLCDIPSYGYCVGTKFTVHGLRYSQVYGRIIAYQNNLPRAFSSYYKSIDWPYLYGVSLTHGQNPREHVWSFAGARDETTSSSSHKCPCMTPYSSSYVPSFIGNDYFCDSGLSYYSWYSVGIIKDDPLWDGEGCSRSSCCSGPNVCGDNSPPWFFKDLPTPTTDDLEVRLCRPGGYGSTPIEVIEIYVQ